MNTPKINNNKIIWREAISLVSNSIVHIYIFGIAFMFLSIFAPLCISK